MKWFLSSCWKDRGLDCTELTDTAETGETGVVDVDVSTAVEDNARSVGAELGQEKPGTQTETSHTQLQLMNFLLSDLFLLERSLEGRLNRNKKFQGSGGF